ncbi:MAG: transporter substrate-binding domain-containing protein [Lachnospiraceae bacterium]|nr:transporter substrate-binding domain-containing protein [Lachnospiraceae bacterium]
MKNKNVKRIVTLGILASLATAAFTGCGSSTSAAEPSKEAEVASEAESEAESEVAESEAAPETEVTTIHAVTGGGPKPYVFVDDNNEPTGYDIEVLKAAFDIIPEYDLDIEVTDFSSVFAGLTAGKYQIGVNNFSYNEERASSYLYSLPYDKGSYVFVYNKDAEPITSLADAAGLSFEGGAGVSVTNAVESWNELNPDAQINITYTDADTAIVLQHIQDGETDFGIIDGPMYTAYVDEYGFDIGKYDIPEEETKLIADNLYAYYLLPQGEDELRDVLDAAIIELKENGTLKELSEKYFGGVDQSPEAEKLAGGKTN